MTNKVIAWEEEEFRAWLQSLPEDQVIGEDGICPLKVWRSVVGENVVVGWINAMNLATNETRYLSLWAREFIRDIDNIRHDSQFAYVPVTTHDCLHVLDREKE